MKSRIRKTVFAVVFLVISLSIIPQSVNAQVRVSVGVTETMETFNPYGDTVSLMFGVWCQVMGCLGTFDFVKGEYVGILAERWEVVDPSVAFAEQFETGGSPRIGYSNPKLDELLVLERQTFDAAKRKKVLSDAMALITEEAPAHFLWRHQLLYGIAKNIDYKPRPNGRIFGEDIRVLQ
jgi:hypothetical protein